MYWFSSKLRPLAGAALALSVAACAGAEDEPQGTPTEQEVSAPKAVKTSQEARHDSAELPVSIAWADSISGSAMATRDGFKARVTNHDSSALQVGVALSGSLDGNMGVSFVAGVTLEPGQTKEVAIPLSKIPVQATSSAAPVRLLALVSESGEPFTIPSSDRFVAFSPALDLAFASDLDAAAPTLALALGADLDDVRIARLINSKVPVRDLVAALPPRIEGAPKGRVHALDGEWKDLIATTNQLLLDELHAPAPRVAYDIKPFPTRYATSMRVCGAWSVQYSDANRGEDFLAEGSWVDFGSWGKWWIQAPVAAKFARLRLLNASTRAVVSETVLDADGCANVSGQGGTSYIAQVSTLLTRGASTYDVRFNWAGIDDRGCERFTEDGAYQCTANDSFEKSVTFPRVVWDYPTVKLTSDSARPAFRVAAVAGQTMSLADSGLKPGRYLVYSNTGCWVPAWGFYWREACADTNAYFGLSVTADARDTTLEKFVIAHELGHQIEAHAGLIGKDASGYSLDDGLPAACKCDHVVSANKIHCLQSRHTWSAAHVEGFAHFVSARTFNRLDESNCSFAYYKEVYYPGFWTLPASTVAPPVQIDCANPRRWMPSWCSATADRSTEWDHLVFYRALNANGTGALSMEDLFQIFKMTPSNLTWAAFRNAAGTLFGYGSDKYNRVMSAAAANGIDR